jgi:cytochrome c-type biogenesis protein CcmH
MMRMLRLALIVLLALATPLAAVQPDEILPDAGLEARARTISQLLRCPVCQGENIDESNAPVARDLRLVVRERLTAGDSDDEVIDFVVARFGEFVLFQPRAEGANVILWVAGPAMLAFGLLVAGLYLRRRGPGGDPVPEALTDADKARLEALLKD